MVAQALQFRNYLRTKMKVGGPEGANNPRTTGFIENRLDSWGMLSEFKDKEVKDLVQFLKTYFPYWVEILSKLNN